MIVYIEKFGFHTDVEYRFDNGLIVLIRGKSGIGKTTIIRAIKWAFYGGTVEGGARAAVTIQYGDYVISRLSPPDCLSVTKRRTSPDDGSETVLLTGVPAQSVVNKIFGNESLFELCCFLKAGSYGTAPMPLFDTNPTTRLHTLTMLTFPDDNDPQIIVDAVRDHLKQEKKAGKASLEVYKAAKREYDLRGSVPEVGDDTVESVTVAIVNMKDHLSKRVRGETELTQLLAHKKSLENKCMSLKKLLSSATDSYAKCLLEGPAQPPDNIAIIQGRKAALSSTITSDEKSLQIIIYKRKEHESVRAVQNLAKPLLEELAESGITVVDLPKTFSRKELQEIHNINAAITSGRKVCTDLDIEYTAEAIVATIESYEQCLAYLRARKEKIAYDDAKFQYDQLAKVEVVTLEAELAAIKAGTTLRECPHCHNRLRIENDCLVKATVALTTKQDVQRKEGELRDARRSNDIKETRRRTMDSLATKGALDFRYSATLEEYAKHDANIHAIGETLSTLRTVKIVTTPVYDDRQADLLHRLYGVGWTKESSVSKTMEIDEAEQRLEHTIKDNRKTLERINEELNKAYISQSNYDAVVQQRHLLEERLRTAQSNYATVCDELVAVDIAHKIITDSLAATSGASYDAIDRLTVRLTSLHKRSDMLEHERRVESLRLVAERNAQEIIDVSLLLQEAVAEHFLRLKTTVDAVNIHLSTVSLELFSYAMSIQLSLYAITTKSNKIPKHSVSIEIIRRGELVPRFDSSLLSEGEKQRIVLAVLLSLGMYVGLSRIPLLLLDEPMQRLDPNERDSALAFLRKINYRRTIIITEHHTIDDEYDHVIALGDN